MEKYSWYEIYSLEKEAGIQGNIAALITAISLILGGLSIEEAAAQTKLTPQQVSSVAKNQNFVNKVKQIKKKKQKMSVTEAIARTIYAEAKGESIEGKRAVASVIYNRADGNVNNMISVVKQRKQFSCWNAGIPKRGSDTDQNWLDCLNIAKEMVNKKFKPTIATNIKHYFNPDKAHPEWGYADKEKKELKEGIKIGNHYFIANVA